MSEKRKDSKGRILRIGESQRKDGRYQYRYDDVDGKRRVIYDWDLQNLRKKEKEIIKQLDEGVSYFNGCTPLSETLERMFSMKRKWRDSTRSTMMWYMSLIKQSRLYHMPINRIKIADCKAYFISLHDDTPKVFALIKIQEGSLFAFLKADTIGQRHLDMFTILIGTGLRISEFAALTIKDIDFTRNVIHVNKQIVRLVGKLAITEPKSQCGNRDIPMTKEVRKSAQNLIQKRKHIKQDMMINGHVGFLSVTRNGCPRTHSDICRYLSQADGTLQ